MAYNVWYAIKLNQEMNSCLYEVHKYEVKREERG